MIKDSKMTNANDHIKLDTKDRKLLSALDFNARMPYTELGRKIGMSKQGAEYKLNTLIRKGVIKGFYPVINVPKLGYLYCRLCLGLQNVTPEKEQEILTYLRAEPRFFWIFSTQGTFDFLIVMWAKSLTEFAIAVADLLTNYGEYVKVKNESLVTDVVHYSNRYLLGNPGTTEIHVAETAARVDIDATDREILNLLCTDARTPLVQIAQKLKISAQVVAYKIKRMEKLKLIEGYRPIIDHRTLGYTYYKLWVNLNYADMGQIRKLYSYIKENPLVLYAIKGIGMPEDLDVEIMVKTNEELYQFIKDLKLRFPSLIGDYKTFMFINTEKVRYLPF